MPFKSRAQQRFMFSAEARGELPKGTAKRWAHHTPDIKKLPNKVRKKKADAVEDPGVFEQVGTVAGGLGGAYTGAFGGGLLGGYAGSNLAGRSSYKDMMANRHVNRGANIVAAGLQKAEYDKHVNNLRKPGLNLREIFEDMRAKAELHNLFGPRAFAQKMENTTVDPSMFLGKAPGPLSKSRELVPSTGGAASNAFDRVRERFEHISRNANRLGFKDLKRTAKFFGRESVGKAHMFRKALGGLGGVVVGGLLGGAGGLIGGGMGGRSLGRQLDALGEKQSVAGLLRGLGQAAATGAQALGRTFGRAPQIAATAAKAAPRWSREVVRNAPKLPPPPTAFGTMKTMAGQVGQGIKQDMQSMVPGVGRALGYGLPLAGLGYMASQGLGQPEQPAQQPPVAAQPQPSPQINTLAYR